MKTEENFNITVWLFPGISFPASLEYFTEGHVASTNPKAFITLDLSIFQLVEYYYFHVLFS